MGGRKGGEGQAKLGRPVERERMWEGQTGMSSPNMRREILQARGVKQGGWLGYPRVDTPVPCRQAGSQADEGRVGQQSGLMRNPRPGKPCCSGGARGVGCARARGAPGHMGGKGLDSSPVNCWERVVQCRGGGSAGGGDSGTASNWRQRARFSARWRLRSQPKSRMRTKPAGRIGSRKRRMNSAASRVMTRCWLWWRSSFQRQETFPSAHVSKR